MMAMLQCCLLVFVLVGCQIHHAESAVTFPANTVVVSIPKKPAVNSAVVTVNATGADGIAFTYTIKSQSPTTTPNVFSIDGPSGAITVTNVTQLNYPTTKDYTLQIEATQPSGGSPLSASTTVTVNLVNKEPTFAKALYTVCVNKDLPAGTSVLQVTASDEDGDTLAYSITTGDTNSIFAIQSSDGTIKVAAAKTIDATPTSYSLTITATDDDATTALTGTTTVSINVKDPCAVTTPAPVNNPVAGVNQSSSITLTPGVTPVPGVTPAPSFATTITASFCMFLVSGAVHLLCIW